MASFESGVVCQVLHQTDGCTKLSVVDFIPENKQTRFPILIERANQWLQQNPTWIAKTCESVDFKCENGTPGIQGVTFSDVYQTLYAHGLRLWLIPKQKQNADLPPQRLAYFDTVPNWVKSGSFSKKFDNFKELLNRVNNILATKPIEGKIVTIETQPMKFSRGKGVDPDRSFYPESGFKVFVIRVFYEVGSPAYEKIGIKDFVPTVTGRPYDTIANLMNVASEWSRNQPNIRVTNLRSIVLKRKAGYPGNVNNDKTSMHANRSEDEEFHRILRLCYVTKSEITDPIAATVAVPNPLTCKNFLPVQLTKGKNLSHLNELAKFETTQQMLVRISDWVNQYDAHLVSAETCSVPTHPLRAAYGPDSTYYLNRNDVPNQLIKFVRLYLTGSYPDPHISMTTNSHYGWFGKPGTNLI